MNRLNRKDTFKLTQRARCLLLKVGRNMPTEDFYQNIRIQKSRWKYIELNEEIYFLFYNKKPNRHLKKSTEEPRKQRDCLLQIRYSKEQLISVGSQWISNWRQIDLFLKNNGIVLQHLQTIEQFLSSPIVIEQPKISKKQQEAWKQLEDLYRRTIDVHPGLQDRINQLSTRQIWAWD